MEMNPLVLQTRCLSSLTKVFADEELAESAFGRATAFLNETYSFQVAYCANLLVKPLFVSVASELGDRVSVRTVGLAPSELPCFHDYDEHVLRTTPGLYPDPLYPYDAVEGIAGIPGQWRSVWIQVEATDSLQPGVYPIEITFTNAKEEVIGTERFELELLPALLPAQKLIHTEWFHTDCLATYYNVEIFSDAHWKLIDQYVETAVRHGMNMILTPVFTPPLDTAVGGERPTVQLVDVEVRDGSYVFGFDNLRKWIELCTSRGIVYFEFSHLYTQWGAKHAPKIVARVDGTLQRIFGWDTDSVGEQYQSFLAQFLPELVAFIQENELEKRSYFHISDEPRRADLEQYRTAAEPVRKLLDGFTIIDALSNFEFYSQGVVTNPIPSNNHIEPFIEHGVKPLWTYYCVSQRVNVSNRFFHMPSYRNRIIGFQMYKFEVEGFLHWGYNFWYSQYSKKTLDPFRSTDALGAFPSGDPFLVYPGEDGPLESIRMEVFYEALQDLRALQLLESSIGRERVLALVEEGLEQPITFSEYPHSMEWLLNKREQINQAILLHAHAPKA
ncbi:hypothetical protein PAESOLCIP111_00032 [Paenibacillus solanacearum]|uniref:Glycoside hydrolase 123 catalytic domain-containing protein n=2 Tax=Paenibacillus solanacearum TaxID=2048548 RepID=A0A916JRA6_9BACL|nr:hypothetical protein PAESOLCIP111_00032 [Paenibacillus solanacearum]